MTDLKALAAEIRRLNALVFESKGLAIEAHAEERRFLLSDNSDDIADALEAQEKLAAELAAARDEANRWCKRAVEHWGRALRARKALQPFADCADAWSDKVSGDTIARVYLRDCRQARAALARGDEGLEPEGNASADAAKADPAAAPSGSLSAAAEGRCLRCRATYEACCSTEWDCCQFCTHTKRPRGWMPAEFRAPTREEYDAGIFAVEAMSPAAAAPERCRHGVQVGRPCPDCGLVAQAAPCARCGGSRRSPRASVTPDGAWEPCPDCTAVERASDHPTDWRAKAITLRREVRRLNRAILSWKRVAELSEERVELARAFAGAACVKPKESK